MNAGSRNPRREAGGSGAGSVRNRVEFRAVLGGVVEGCVTATQLAVPPTTDIGLARLTRQLGAYSLMRSRSLGLGLIPVDVGWFTHSHRLWSDHTYTTSITNFGTVIKWLGSRVWGRRFNAKRNVICLCPMLDAAVCCSHLPAERGYHTYDSRFAPTFQGESEGNTHPPRHDSRFGGRCQALTGQRESDTLGGYTRKPAWGLDFGRRVWDNVRGRLNTTLSPLTRSRESDTLGGYRRFLAWGLDFRAPAWYDFKGRHKTLLTFTPKFDTLTGEGHFGAVAVL